MFRSLVVLALAGLLASGVFAAETPIVASSAESRNTVGLLSYNSLKPVVGANYAFPTTGGGVISNDLTFVVGATANGDAVVLPAPQDGIQILIANTSSYELALFSGGVSQINGLPATSYVTLTPGSLTQFVGASTGLSVPTWFTPSVGYGVTGNIPTSNYASGLTAAAAGTQAGGTPITRVYNRFVTVAGAGYSATLQASATLVNAVYSVTVHNAGANSMNIFPAVGEAINAQAINAAYALTAGKTATFNCAAGVCSAVLSA